MDVKKIQKREMQDKMIVSSGMNMLSTIIDEERKKRGKYEKLCEG